MSYTLRSAAARGMLAAVALVAAAAPALAQDQTIDVTGSPRRVTASERVSYAGLDLSTAQGQQRLASRIRAAADRVCTGDGEVWNAFADLNYRRCYTQAKAGAARQAPVLMVASAN